jgi:DNA-directed RNA polymerase I, II, and III subunit RPABC2
MEDEDYDPTELEETESLTENEPILSKRQISSKEIEEELESDTETKSTADIESDGEGDEYEDDEEIDADIEEVEPEFIEAKTEIQRPAFAEIQDISDDEEEDDDDNYLQKFDSSIQEQIISDFHPELMAHNYDEVDNLARVVRDENGNIIDPLHQTIPFITRYEKARILGERAKQINSGGKPFVEVEPTVIDGYLIALKEFEEKKIPFIIKRPLPNGGCEYWKFEDLEVL